MEPVSEILLNVTRKFVSLQWHFNNVLLYRQVICYSGAEDGSCVERNLFPEAASQQHDNFSKLYSNEKINKIFIEF